MFFNDWYGLYRIIIITPMAYIALITVLRLAGKRTLSKMNAFDLIVTVAIGSMFATVILSRDVAVLEGVLAFAMLGLLQFAMSWFSVRYNFVESLVKARPTLLVYRHEYLRDVMKGVRITESEVRAALRNSGTPLEKAEAVVLETDGTLTVVPASDSKTYDNIFYDIEPHPDDVKPA